VKKKKKRVNKFLRLGHFEPIGDAASLFRYVIYK
jgi:hypothetical protein